MASKSTKNMVWIGAAVLIGGGALVWYLTRKRRPSFVPPPEAPPVPEGTPSALPPLPSACTVSGQTTPTPAAVPPVRDLTDPAKIGAVLQGIASKYGLDVARNVERIYRLETAHFTSGQYKATGSPGMVKASASYPFGWSSLKSFWDANPNAKPVGSVAFCVNGKTWEYLAFPQGWGMVALAEVLQKRGNNPGAWYSNDPVKQQEYANKVYSIQARYV